MTDRYERIRAALAECRDIAMEWTLRGRIPECGKFGEIAQSLDAVCAELAFLASAPVSVPRGWKLVPIEPTPEMLAANGTCELAAGQQMLNDDARETWHAMLSAAPSPTEKIAARQQPAGDGCHCATCTCDPNMTPAVRFDLSPAQMEGAIREHLIRLGWTPPDERAASQPAEQRAEIEALRAEVDGTIRELLAERDQLAAVLEATQRGLRYAVRVWVLSDEIMWSEKEIDEAVERIIGDAKKETRND